MNSYDKKQTWWDEQHGHPKVGKVAAAAASIFAFLIVAVTLLGVGLGWFNK